MAVAPTADQARLFTAAFLRSLVVGLTGVVLALYLHSIGWDIRRTGLLVSVGLAGSAVVTLLTSLMAHRIGYRQTLLLLGEEQRGRAQLEIWKQLRSREQEETERARAQLFQFVYTGSPETGTR